MSHTRGIQLSVLQNMDRLLIRSMLGVIARHLKARWMETNSGPVAVLADADTADGFRVLEQAKRSGIYTIGLTSRPLSPWNFLLSKPPQSKDLLSILEKIDLQELQRVESRPLKAVVPVVSEEVQESLLKANNLFDHFVRQQRSGIVELRFSPGRSLMINHDTGEYCSAMTIQQITQLGTAHMQETQHGAGQAVHDWKIATRILPVGTLEMLVWATIKLHGKNQLLPQVKMPCKLSRSPRLTEPMTSIDQTIAKFLSRSPGDIADIVRATRAPRAEVIAFVNAAFACHLLGTQISAPANLAFMRVGEHFN